MTYEWPRWRRILFYICTLITYFMSFLSIVSLFICSDHLFTNILPVACFGYANFMFSVAATSISIDGEIIYFNRIIDKKQMKVSDIISIYKSNIMGCLIFKNTSGKILAFKNIENIKEAVQVIKTRNPAVSVVL